ncbi:hypothetical protein [Geodermatophilus sp. URMC 63]
MPFPAHQSPGDRLTANVLSAAVCTPILGRLGDMVGKRRVFAAAWAPSPSGA